MSKRAHGYSLSEVLIVIAIVGLFASMILPACGTMLRRAALRAAAGELRAILHMARHRAIAKHVHVGVKFSLDGGEWQYALYEDGDGDGIRNNDIARGVDPRVTPPRPALRESRAATIGLLRRAIKDPDGDPLKPTASPVQFNRSTLCSFSPFGESTPGTIYLTDRGNELYAVRVYGATAKIRSLRFDGRKWVAR